MGLFDFFKKKDTNVDKDSFQYKILNMHKGSVFDYDLKSWVVLQVYEYKWQNGAGSVEYLVDDGSKQWYLSVQKDDKIEMALTERIKVRVIDPELPDTIIRTEQPPNSIVYKNVEYLLDTESVGMFRESGNEEWSDLISWDFYDRSDKKVLCIEQWGERDFEAATGVTIAEYEVTNILPAPSSNF